jgi:hypothetical protein
VPPEAYPEMKKKNKECWGSQVNLHIDKRFFFTIYMPIAVISTSSVSKRMLKICLNLNLTLNRNYYHGSSLAEKKGIMDILVQERSEVSIFRERQPMWHFPRCGTTNTRGSRVVQVTGFLMPFCSSARASLDEFLDS